MSKPVIAIDFDDTIVFNAGRVVEAYNKAFDAHVSLDDVYVAEKYGNPAHGWHHNREEAREWIRTYLVSPEGLKNPPLPGAHEVLGRLKAQYDLYVVTGRSLAWHGGTVAWLDRFLPGVFQDIEHCGDTPKSDVCARIGAQIIIDDSPHYLQYCVDAGMRAILFGDYPWNRVHTLPPTVEKAPDWIAVERRLHG